MDSDHTIELECESCGIVGRLTGPTCILMAHGATAAHEAAHVDTERLNAGLEIQRGEYRITWVHSWDGA